MAARKPEEEEGAPRNPAHLIASGTLILSGMPALGTLTDVWHSGSMTSADAS